MASQTQRALYAKNAKKSLCRKKKVSNPNVCKKIRQCKVAKGSKRTYCRKRRATRYSKRKA